MNSLLPMQVARALAQQQRLRGLGDYDSELYNRVLPPGEDVAQSSSGILPIKPAEVTAGTVTPEQMMQEMVLLLRSLPSALSLEWSKRFGPPPRERMPFVATAAGVTLGAGATVTVVSQLVDERFGGFLTHVGVSVLPPGSFSDIQWSIKINGSVHPKFSGKVFNANSLATPFPFSFEICSSRTVELVATNAGLAGLDVSGVLLGWTEFLTDYKGYGNTPSGGIG